MPNKNFSMLHAKDRANNEYYTTRENIEGLFELRPDIAEWLKGKIIYCPCDTEQSEIYKYLCEHQSEWGIKEIIHTSDDYYGHMDLYEKCDIVFTNPPFTGIKRWTQFLFENNIHFIIYTHNNYFWSTTKFIRQKFIEHKINVLIKDKSIIRHFIHEEHPTMVNTAIITDIDLQPMPERTKWKYDIISKAKTIDELKLEGHIDDYNGTPMIHHMRYFPTNYYQDIYVPTTTAFGYNHMFIIYDDIVYSKTNTPRIRVRLIQQ